MTTQNDNSKTLDREAVDAFLNTISEIVETTESLARLGYSVEQGEVDVPVSFPFQILQKEMEKIQSLFGLYDNALRTTEYSCTEAEMDCHSLEYLAKALLRVPAEDREFHLNMGFFTLSAMAQRIQEGISRVLAGTEFDSISPKKAA